MIRGPGSDLDRTAPERSGSDEIPRVLVRTFLLLWVGLLVSGAGSLLRAFALDVWIFQRTGSATVYGLVGVAAVVPQLLFAPLAGVLTDRWGHRKALIAAEAGAGVCSLATAALFRAGALGTSTIIAIVGLSSCFVVLGTTAFMPAVTQLVPPAQLARAQGLLQLGGAASQITMPAVAGILLPTIGLGSIIAVDLATFAVAVAVLAVVRIPPPQESAAGREAKGSVWEELTYGSRYVRRRPGLMGLLLFNAAVNFNLGVAIILLTPMVLGFADTGILGTIFSIGGVGMLAGSLLMMTWGGPRRHVVGLLAGAMLQGLFMLLGAAKASFAPTATAVFGVMFAMPLFNACSQIIWQRKVPGDVQGRVFSFRMMIGNATTPLAFLLAAPLAEHVFEPWMAPGGRLSSSLGRVLGTGSGRGVAVLFVLSGLLTITATIVAFFHPRIRLVEAELPDAEPEPDRPRAPGDSQ